MQVATLRSYAGQLVCVRLRDESEHSGTLRTELLSEHSISVYLAQDDGDGATLYLDDIVRVLPVS